MSKVIASSDGTAAQVGSSIQGAKAMRIPMRPLKIVIGVSLLMAGVYGVVSDRQILSTDSAVVTAYVTEVRTPVEGVLTGMPASTGGRFVEGAVLGTIDNHLYDQQHLQNLRLVERQASSQADAAESESEALDSQKAALLRRAQRHMSAVSGRLEGQKTEAERLLSARTAELQEARRELDRGRKLYDAGILAYSELEKLQSQDTVATENEAAQRAAVDTIQGEIQSAQRGTLSEPGMNNDVSYSRQRADEVSIRLAQVDQTRVALEAQADEADLSISAETERMMTMRHSDLVSPVSGMLWKLEAVNGERVSTGDAVAQMVQCDQSFVLAEVAQRRLPDVALGAQARLRLTGETRDLYGKVTDISDDAKQDDHSKLAALPPQDPKEHRATVRITLDEKLTDNCAVGRSARVIIAVKHSGLTGLLWGHP